MTNKTYNKRHKNPKVIGFFKYFNEIIFLNFIKTRPKIPKNIKTLMPKCMPAAFNFAFIRSLVISILCYLNLLPPLSKRILTSGFMYTFYTTIWAYNTATYWMPAYAAMTVVSMRGQLII